jgi:LmbE family N-acetylglucosaminyl deacetylase
LKNIIVISAHPDDETLGAGGTLLKHVANGDRIHWLIVTDISETSGFSQEVIARRAKEIVTVTEMYGFLSVHKLGYPTMSLTGESLLTMVPMISTIFMEVQPEIIYTLNRSDAHSDHRVIFDAVAACTKSFRYPFIKQVLMYECISETEFAPALPERFFQPNYYVDISKFLKRKIEIMNVFASEMGEHPFPRSAKNIEALAVFRGASVGVEYAESFQLIKFIDK